MTTLALGRTPTSRCTRSSSGRTTTTCSSCAAGAPATPCSSTPPTSTSSCSSCASASASAGCSRRTATGTTSRPCRRSARPATRSPSPSSTRPKLKDVGYDVFLDDAEVIEVGELRLDAIHNPGHTPGSISFHVRGTPLLFTGDTLFPGGPGNTKFEDGDFADDHPLDRVAGCSRSPTRRSSCPATASTRRSAPSARTSTSGSPAAGEPRCAHGDAATTSGRSTTRRSTPPTSRRRRSATATSRRRRGSRRRPTCSPSAPTCRARPSPSTSGASGRGCCGGPDRPRAATPATGRPGPTTPPTSYTLRLFPDGRAEGAGPSGSVHDPLPGLEGRPPRPRRGERRAVGRGQFALRRVGIIPATGA